MVLLAFLAIAGFFLLTGHRAYLFGVLPFLLLLACPLLHFSCIADRAARTRTRMPITEKETSRD